MVLVRSEVLGQSVKNNDCRLQLFSLESGEFTATSSNADISKTKNFFCIFYCFTEITLNLEYFEKKDQSHSLSITEINNCRTSSYLCV